MAHYQQLKFLEIALSKIPFNSESKILEIGSYDVNGTIRQFFPNNKIIGIDISSGPNVDIIYSGYHQIFQNHSFDLIICCEVFEHTPHWEEVIKHIMRYLKSDGICIITCASTGRLEHGTRRVSPMSSPGTQAEYHDYYKNLSKNDLKRIIKKYQLVNYYLKYNFFSSDLYFVFCLSSDSAKNIKLNKLLKSRTCEVYRNDPRSLSSFHIRMLLWCFRLISFFMSDRLYQNITHHFLKALIKIKALLLNFFGK